VIGEPLPIECDRCPPSEVTGARPRFTDTPGGRTAHARVFNHTPVHHQIPEEPLGEENPRCES
jgi:hypothetical protein